VAESAADQIGALFGERKLSGYATNSVGSEQLSLLGH